MTMTEFVTNLPDIPRIITALAEWLACLVCILPLRKRERIRRGTLAAVSIGFLAIQSFYMVITDGFDGIVWNLCMVGAVFLMFCYIRGCAAVALNNAVCCCCTAFIGSEFAASIAWQIWCYIYDHIDVRQNIWKTLVVVFIYVIVFSCLWKINKSIFLSDEEFSVKNRETIFVVMISLLIFAVSNLGFLPVSIIFAGRDSVEIFNMRTMVDLGGLAALYAYQSQLKSSYIQRELETIQTILNSQYEQYKQTQRAVDMINYRYHDLKNHIIALRTDSGGTQRNKYLDKLESEIRDYEAMNKTGNQVLDTLLTSKNLRCMQHKINMTSVIDGSLFDSMDAMDICSIFGNAIDNAIECEIKIKDYEKRMIHVDAFCEKSFIIIRFENYYEGEIRFEKGMPVTSKKDTSLHGYGLKSLRYTVRKYRGEVQIDTRDSWFSLRILIPLDMKK